MLTCGGRTGYDCRSPALSTRSVLSFRQPKREASKTETFLSVCCALDAAAVLFMIAQPESIQHYPRFASASSSDRV